MKTKVSISIDESTADQIEGRVSEGSFRNRSHFVEYAIKKLLMEAGKEGEV